MTEQNKFKSLIVPWLSPAGALMVLVCFFVPWLEVRCSGKKIIGSGFSFAADEFLLWLIPVCALLTLIVFWWLRNRTSVIGLKIGLITTAALGILMMVMTYLSIEQKMSGFIVRTLTNYHIKPGLLGTILGFIIIIAAAIFSKPPVKEQETEN